jgi:diaminopimelate epimerase
MGRPFVKMNGLGNDFVVVEALEAPFKPTHDVVRAIASRGGGVGCDQLIVLEPSENANAFMRIWNADGLEVEACGNAARCVGWLLMQALRREAVTIETVVGVLHATRAGEGLITVDMGVPGLEWGEIPLSGPMDTRELDLRMDGGHGGPGCVSVGNPHLVFFVADVLATPVMALGPWFETHKRFPARTNVEFTQVLARDHLRVRVWERGVGVTTACGTGACAAVVAASRRDLADRTATVTLDGGDLTIEWRESDDHLLMTGPIAVEFVGRLPAMEVAL